MGVFRKSEKVKDIELKKGLSVKDLVRQFSCSGFQASNVAAAAELLKRIKKEDCTVFLSFTANMMASGLRGVFIDLIREGFVDVVVTTGGAVDHDVIRAFDDYLVGDFGLDDIALHKKNINRLGNVLIPNDRYVLLEKKIQNMLKDICDDRRSNNRDLVFSPSDLIGLIGKKTGKGLFYECQKREIPVFSPGITDSAIGLQSFFFKESEKKFIIDTTKDMNKMAAIAGGAKKTAGIILGGGISKHYALGSNLLRGGFNYSVYVTTSPEWDGSLSGARTHEAKSWGKIKETANTVTVYGDATIIVPLVFAALR